MIGIVNQAVANIDTQIKGYEEAVRQEKLEKVKEIYQKTIGDLDRAVPFEKIYKDSWLNVSTTFEIWSQQRSQGSEIKLTAI